MNRWYWPAATALLVLMAALMIASAWGDAPTFDESFHLAAGFGYWTRGDFSINPEHPPLSKLLAALPLLLTPVRLPQVRFDDPYEMAAQFLYENAVEAGRMLFLARLPIIAATVGLGLGLACFVRRRWGHAASLVALGLYTTDPNFIAHGHYVTSDLLVTAAIFWAAITWLNALESGRPRHLALAALALGCALAAKFSAIFLIAQGLLAWRGRWLRFAAVAAAALLVVALTYGPATLQIPQTGPLAEKLPDNPPIAAALRQVAQDFHLPAHPFLLGLWEVVRHNHLGHSSYLLGHVSPIGDWRYFPVAFAVKTPAAVLALLLLALAARWFPRWLLYPALYFAIAMASHLNIGLRHLLPVYPFLFAWIAVAVVTRFHGRWRAIALAAAFALQTFELARIHPHHISFFNLAAGGPASGHQLLLDSNVDWGQDAIRLATWMRQQRLTELCTSYFGTARLTHYGIHARPVHQGNCIAAVSVTNLHDLYTPPGTHAWARRRAPMGRIGHSIFLYDLRGKP